MSGGSWKYLFSDMQEAAEALERDFCLDYGDSCLRPDQTLARRKLAGYMRALADVMYKIERVDSGDCCYPDDVNAINEFLVWLDSGDCGRPDDVNALDEFLAMYEKKNKEQK